LGVNDSPCRADRMKNLLIKADESTAAGNSRLDMAFSYARMTVVGDEWQTPLALLTEFHNLAERWLDSFTQSSQRTWPRLG
jgi:hypothetical protein